MKKTIKNLNNKYPFLSRLGNITTPYNGKTRYDDNHKGIDIANKKGTPIPALTSGFVEATKTGEVQGSSNYGNSVISKDENGNALRYSHMDKVFVRPKQYVKRGQIIGTMGDSGNTYSPSGSDASHLDLRMLDAYNKYRDPSKIKKIKKLA